MIETQTTITCWETILTMLNKRRKQMELVLPNNYVVIDEEEMMYLDGEG